MENNQIKRIKDYLNHHGYRLTPQRETTVEVLLENNNSHLSAEEIYIRVHEKNPSIGLATVYRTLEMLTEMEIVDKINFQDGLTRYDLVKPTLGHAHHHLVCQKCGKIIEIEDDLLTRMTPFFLNKYHFQLQDHQMTLYGLCENCQRGRNNARRH